MGEGPGQGLEKFGKKKVVASIDIRKTAKTYSGFFGFGFFETWKKKPKKKRKTEMLASDVY